jgi:hypothetical protein
MDIVYSKQLLNIHIENSNRILDSNFGVNHAEPTFFAIIKILRNTPELKSFFLEKVERFMCLPDPSGVHQDLPSQELIELISHELKWQELVALAYNRVNIRYKGDWSFAAGEISQSILDAMKTDWPDRMFYEKYQND